MFKLGRSTGTPEQLTDFELTFHPLLVPLPVVPLYLLVVLQGLNKLGASKVCLQARVGDPETARTGRVDVPGSCVSACPGRAARAEPRETASVA